LLLTSLGAHISSDDARGEELCARAFSALWISEYFYIYTIPIYRSRIRRNSALLKSRKEQTALLRSSLLFYGAAALWLTP
jgi:hypothetical protein